jgi:hypothetical protein
MLQIKKCQFVVCASTIQSGALCNPSEILSPSSYGQRLRSFISRFKSYSETSSAILCFFFFFRFVSCEGFSVAA